MKIATWNINSIKAHLEAAMAWLKEAQPDVLCLQELKCEEAAFPALSFAELGYNAAVHGQKTYNGVAILAKGRLEDVRRGLPGEAEDEQARYIEAVVRVASIYLPNGNPPDTEKYAYKLRWMSRLKAHAKSLLALEENLVLAGDYNVIPAAIDARFPESWRDDALFLPQTRAKFQELINLGLSDGFRACAGNQAGHYTFWDYQAGAWPKNNGIRIDHHLLSPQALDQLVAVHIDSHVRGWERPSDHVPVVLTLK